MTGDLRLSRTLALTEVKLLQLIWSSESHSEIKCNPVFKDEMVSE